MAIPVTPSTKKSTTAEKTPASSPAQDKRVAITRIPNYQEYVQVIVGKDGNEETFFVHQHLLIDHSPFFKAALTGNWIESTDQLVKLPEDEPDIFKIYVHFLYAGCLAVVPAPLPEPYFGGKERNTLAKFYVLVEKLQDSKAKNATLEAMLQSSRQKYGTSCGYPHWQTCQIIYEGTPKGSPMRKLLVDYYTYKAAKNWMEKSTDWPEEFMYELLVNVFTERAKLPEKAEELKASDYFETVEDPDP